MSKKKREKELLFRGPTGPSRHPASNQPVTVARTAEGIWANRPPFWASHGLLQALASGPVGTLAAKGRGKPGAGHGTRRRRPEPNVCPDYLPVGRLRLRCSRVVAWRADQRENPRFSACFEVFCE